MELQFPTMVQNMTTSKLSGLLPVLLSLLITAAGCVEESFDDIDVYCLCGDGDPSAEHVDMIYPAHSPIGFPIMLQNDKMIFQQFDTSDNCKLLKNAVIGQWHADLPTGRLRYDFNRDGSYDLYRFKNDKWKLTSSGKFWISYQLVRGLLRAQFHMTLNDGIDHPISFYIQNGNIVFEDHIGDVDKLEFSPYVP